MKTVIAFIIALVVGAALTLVVRSALHDPHAGHATATVAPTAAPASPAVTARDPHVGHAVGPAVDPHAGHAPDATAASAVTTPDPAPPAPVTVNSICPICGMDVDPALGVWHYQGKPIGIGCRACIDKIENEIDRYGPAALDNKRLR